MAKHGCRFIDRTGQTFGRLIVNKFAGKTRRGQSLWLCVCQCGEKYTVSADSLVSGNTTSCGCYRREVAAENGRRFNTKHGHASTPEYRAWIEMRRREENGRGYCPTYANVKICRRWRESFSNFLADMGNKPSPQHSLSRFADTGDYKPGNVVWHTRKQQHAEAAKKRRTLCI